MKSYLQHQEQRRELVAETAQFAGSASVTERETKRVVDRKTSSEESNQQQQRRKQSATTSANESARVNERERERAPGLSDEEQIQHKPTHSGKDEFGRDKRPRADTPEQAKSTTSQSRWDTRHVPSDEDVTRVLLPQQTNTNPKRDKQQRTQLVYDQSKWQWKSFATANKQTANSNTIANTNTSTSTNAVADRGTDTNSRAATTPHIQQQHFECLNYTEHVHTRQPHIHTRTSNNRNKHRHSQRARTRAQRDCNSSR